MEIKYYAFGEIVPQSFIEELLKENIPEEEITTEFLETLLEYDRRNNEYKCESNEF